MHSPDKKFLIIKLSSLGDVVHTLPVLSTLRKNHPRAFIAWVVEENYKDLLAHNPNLDEVIPIRTKAWRKNWNVKTLKGISEVVRRLRQHRFDIALDLQGLIKSGVIACLSGARKKIGFHPQNCRESMNTWFTNHKGPETKPGTHVVDIYLSLLELVDDCHPPTLGFPLESPPETGLLIDTFFKNHSDLSSKPVIGINPGAGFETKLWNLDRFASLADRISDELGCSILLTWGPGEEKMVQHIGEEMTRKFWIAPPTTILESIPLYRKLSLLVSCDSGPLHVCAALGIPTVALFGPTDPARNGPYGSGHEVVSKTLPCSHCWKKTCPLHTKECMDSISVEEVFERVKKSAATNIKVVAS